MDRHECLCGSIIMNTGLAIKRHGKTKKHLQWEQENGQESESKYPDLVYEDCGICYEPKKSRIVVCTTCDNDICMKCFIGMKSHSSQGVRCPFCRACIQTAPVYKLRNGRWETLSGLYQRFRPLIKGSPIDHSLEYKLDIVRTLKMDEHIFLERMHDLMWTDHRKFLQLMKDLLEPYS